MTLRQPGKLIAMIPDLLARLHAGLALLDKDPLESEPFFKGLIRIHQPVLKLRRLKIQRDAEEPATEPPEPDEMPATPEQRQATAADQPWLGRHDRQAAGFDDMLPSAHDDLAAPEPEPESVVTELVPLRELDVSSDERAPVLDDAAGADEGVARVADPDPRDAASDAESALLALSAGDWVDLFYRRRWLRAQLVWASSKGALFMFVSHGGRAHSMTRRSCERLLRERLLVPVDSQGVVAQAVNVVVNEAAARAGPESAERPG